MCYTEKATTCGLKGHALPRTTETMAQIYITTKKPTMLPPNSQQNKTRTCTPGVKCVLLVTFGCVMLQNAFWYTGSEWKL